MRLKDDSALSLAAKRLCGELKQREHFRGREVLAAAKRKGVRLGVQPLRCRRPGELMVVSVSDPKSSHAVPTSSSSSHRSGSSAPKSSV